jgi:spermidine/putrescine transport system permease protein
VAGGLARVQVRLSEGGTTKGDAVLRRGEVLDRETGSERPTSHVELGRSPSPARRAVLRWKPRAALLLRALFLGLVVFVLYGPIVILALFSFNDSIVIALPFEGFTTRWYGDALTNPVLLEGLKNSLVLALVVTPVSLVLGTLAAFAVTRFRYRGRGAVTSLVGAPLIVPWLLVGVGALMFFNRIHVPLSLRTIGLMHVTVAFPLVAAIVAARLVRFDRRLEEAALDLGGLPREVLRYIVLPHVAPALAAAAIFAFSYSFNNFVISFFTGGFELTFPIWVFSTLRHAQNVPIVNAISTLVSVLQVVVVLLAWRVSVGSKRRGGGGVDAESVAGVLAGQVR